jgi:hypothetical protein
MEFQSSFSVQTKKALKLVLSVENYYFSASFRIDWKEQILFNNSKLGLEM